MSVLNMQMLDTMQLDMVSISKKLDEEYKKIINNYLFFETIRNGIENVKKRPLENIQLIIDVDVKEIKKYEEILILRNDLATNFTSVSKYEYFPKTSNNTGISIILNKEQILKIKARVRNNIDPVDFDNYKTDYMEMLLKIYRHYGKQNDSLQSLNVLNKMSRSYAQFNIEYIEPIYDVFTRLQRAIYSRIHTIRDIDLAKNIERYIKDEEQKIIIELWMEERNRKLKPLDNPTNNTGQDMKNNEHVITSKYGQSYNSTGIVKRHTKDEKQIIISKKKDTVNILYELPVYKDFLADIHKDIKTGSFVLLRTKCRRILSFNIKTTYGEHNSFENHTLIFEIRSYQIKIYYVLFVIVSHIYDAWRSTLDNVDETKQEQYIMENLKKICAYVDENMVLIKDIYKNITVPFISILKTQSDENIISNITLYTIKRYIESYTKNILEFINDKYYTSPSNYNLYIVLKTHRYFVLFENYIYDLLDKWIKKNIIHLIVHGTGLNNTIITPLALGVYLTYYNNINNTVAFIDELSIYTENKNLSDVRKEEIKKTITEHKEIIKKIYGICDKYRVYKYEFSNDKLDGIESKLCETLFNFYGSDLSKLRMMAYFIRSPEMTILNFGDQTNIDNIVYSKRSHPSYVNNAEFNQICDVLDNSQAIPVRRGVYGLTGDILKFNFCSSKYTVNPTPYILHNITYFFDFTHWSPLINSVELYVNLNTRSKTVYYARDVKKPVCPYQHAEDGPDRIVENLNNIRENNIYIGVMIINTRSIMSINTRTSIPKFKKVVIYIFWSMKLNMFFLADHYGSRVNLGTIIYTPFITYHELKQLYYHYKQDFIKLKNEVYISKKNNNPKKDEKTRLCI